MSMHKYIMVCFVLIFMVPYMCGGDNIDPDTEINYIGAFKIPASTDAAASGYGAAFYPGGDSGIRFDTGLYADISGTGAEFVIFYLPL